jgi:hypothetical protein
MPLPAIAPAERTGWPRRCVAPRAERSIRRARSGVDAAAAAREPSFIGSAAFSSLAAELDAQDEEPASGTSRKWVLALGGVAAVVTLVVVAANLQGRSNDAHRAPVLVPGGFVVNDSAGKTLPATQPSAANPAPAPASTARQVGPRRALRRQRACRRTCPNHERRRRRRACR